MCAAGRAASASDCRHIVYVGSGLMWTQECFGCSGSEMFVRSQINLDLINSIKTLLHRGYLSVFWFVFLNYHHVGISVSTRFV